MVDLRIKKVHDRFYVEEYKDIAVWIFKRKKEWVDVDIFGLYTDGKMRSYPFKKLEYAEAYIELVKTEYKRKNSNPEYIY